MPDFKKLIKKTQDVLSVEWSVKDLKIPSWVVSAVIWITCTRALAYGLELLILVPNPISPILAFAAVFGLQYWGFLILGALLILVIGLLAKRSFLVTIGSLACTAVWVAFAMSLGIGWIDLGTGGRFFISHLATALTFGLLFIVQLRHIRKNGVGNEDQD